MDHDRSVAALESEWSPPGGFFWRARQGDFRPDDFRRALSVVAAVHPPEAGGIPRRLVSLLWYIPSFMQWQTERVRESGGDAEAYVRSAAIMTNEIERILGVP